MWLRRLPKIWKSGSLACVHAAADPALPLTEQSRHTLLWGHSDFFNVPRSDGLWVAHGHTALPSPRFEQSRISLDTGAYVSGMLSAARVLPDGTVDFPFAGSIRVGGQSTSQVQQTLTANLASNFATPPTVFVSVNSVFTDPLDALGAGVPSDAINVYFTGEINAPGLRPMASRTTFLQAIAQSGGFTRFAATKRVQLRRTDPKTGVQTVYALDYDAITRGATANATLELQDGDVILVPTRRLFE